MFKPTCARDPKFAFPRKMSPLKWNGAWPCVRDPQKSWQILPQLYALWAWLVIANIGLNCYCQAVYLFYNLNDVAKSTENVCTTMMGMLSFIRLIHLRFSQRKLHQLLQMFVDDICIPKSSYPRIARGCEERMQPFGKMALAVMCTVLMYIVFPIVYLLTNNLGLDAPNKPFPYQMIHPYEAQRPWRYVVTYILAALGGLSVVTMWFAQDTTFGLFISYACGQYDILHQQIARLVPECHEQCRRLCSEDDGLRLAAGVTFRGHVQQLYVRRLHEISFKHSKLIKFCALLEQLNGFPLLVNFVISTFLICAIAFQFMSGNIIFIGDYVKFVAFFLAVMGQLYVICANGHALVQHSTATAWHLYACNWEGGRISDHSPLLQDVAELPARQRAPLLQWRRIDYCPTGRDFQLKMKFMIMRSQRPVQLTALKFSVLSLQSFTTLLSTSLSYFTMLRQFLDK